MSTINVEVDNYWVQLGYKTPGAASGSSARGIIGCLGREGYTLYIYLADNGDELAPPRFDIEKKTGSITVPVSEMYHYVDLLRNEKPIFLYMDSVSPELNHIRTSNEPVGEGE